MFCIHHQFHISKFSRQADSQPLAVHTVLLFRHTYSLCCIMALLLNCLAYLSGNYKETIHLDMSLVLMTSKSLVLDLIFVGVCVVSLRNTLYSRCCCFRCLTAWFVVVIVDYYTYRQCLCYILY